MPAISLTFSKKSKLALNKMYQEINHTHGEQILQIHKLLESHITLLLTKYNENEKQIIVKAINKISKTFSNSRHHRIKIEGIGIFQKGSNRYNLHFNVAYDENMQKLHKEIWKELGRKINIQEKEHYHPSSFVPHISIPIFKKHYNKTLVMKVLNQMLHYNLKDIYLELDFLSYIYGSLQKPDVYHKKQLINS